MRPGNRRARFASIAGNALEWYDFAIYGYFAATIGQQFFPNNDPAVSLIASFGVFAIGFVARPIGAIIFGNIGDRVGRRHVLILSVMMMAIPTTAIGLLPTYSQIGIWAPAILIVLRLLQGLSVGGEMTGSITYMVEGAEKTHRGRSASWAYFGVGIGFLLGSAVGSAATTFIPATDVAEWGWRIPFLCGSIIAIFGYLIRRHGLEEGYQPQKEAHARQKSPLHQVITKHFKTIVQAIGIAAFFASGFYLIFVYLTTYAVQVVGETASDAFDINSINMMIYALLSLVGGYLGDRFGFRRVLLITVTAGLVMAWPLFWLIDHPDPVLTFLGQLGFVLILAPYGALVGTTMSLLFPPEVRMSGFSLSYNVVFAALGGTAPLLASYLIHRNHGELSPAYVLIVCALISLLSLAWAWKSLPGRQSAERA